MLVSSHGRHGLGRRSHEGSHRVLSECHWLVNHCGRGSGPRSDPLHQGHVTQSHSSSASRLRSVRAVSTFCTSTWRGRYKVKSAVRARCTHRVQTKIRMRFFRHNFGNGTDISTVFVWRTDNHDNAESDLNNYNNSNVRSRCGPGNVYFCSPSVASCLFSVFCYLVIN